MGYALRRKMEAEGEAEMRDAAPEVEQEEAVQRQIAEEDMEIR